LIDAVAHRAWDLIENPTNQKVSLNGGQVFSYDLDAEAQTKQASRGPWSSELDEDLLD
jgi:hypothetical protein